VQLVLIVEDDPGIQDVLRFLAEANEMSVVTANTCDMAIQMAESHRPDIAVVDLGLPDRDGIQLIRNMRTWSRAPIIVLSARTLRTFSQECVRCYPARRPPKSRISLGFDVRVERRQTRPVDVRACGD
jgi:CheY-like chemotaxis protein